MAAVRVEIDVRWPSGSSVGRRSCDLEAVHVVVDVHVERTQSSPSGTEMGQNESKQCKRPRN